MASKKQAWGKDRQPRLRPGGGVALSVSPVLALTSILLLCLASCSTPPPVCSLYTLAYQGEASPGLTWPGTLSQGAVARSTADLAVRVRKIPQRWKSLHPLADSWRRPLDLLTCRALCSPISPPEDQAGQAARRQTHSLLTFFHDPSLPFGTLFANPEKCGSANPAPSLVMRFRAALSIHWHRLHEQRDQRDLICAIRSLSNGSARK